MENPNWKSTFFCLVVVVVELADLRIVGKNVRICIEFTGLKFCSNKRMFELSGPRINVC